ncbi:MAG: inositol monophosphatase family protein [Deferribacterota bacterium]|nr:inositol monophosphatase family protein [Deferribacterota bacterium]
MDYELVEIVFKAGDILKEGLKKNIKANYKGKADIVTEIDLKSEEFLKKELGAIYKDHIIIAEESESYLSSSGGKVDNNSESKKDIADKNVIYIDPLDGTTNYYHHFPFFAISIGFYSKGVAQKGIVYNPYLNEFYFAERGKGAYLNGRKINVSSKESIEESLIVTGFTSSVINKDGSIIMKQLKNISEKCHGIRRVGSAALDLCYVARGVFEAFYERGLKPWDIAAGKLIVEEAGGYVTNEKGKEHNLNSNYIIATNKYIHNNLIGLINEY